ncbi:hypothetical protein NECAME_06005 [Necator americanus]|uniref:Phospholipase A2 n=1 Tax=Necator americanus TaxID=51031 RepID=W2TXD3_NECAM|nr:hypothetical protein NECAME_06005 [Necator americanus]ETN86299.1 hypothetical protein NECAME_06005 [Necator americanus]
MFPQCAISRHNQNDRNRSALSLRSDCVTTISAMMNLIETIRQFKKKIMKRRRLVVLLVFNITSCVCISPDDWFCGFTNDHKLRLHKLFDGNCAQYRVPINFCCARHKDCYRLQLGKRHCDSGLCLCVEKYSENKDGCGPPIVRSCKDARMYGEKAYDAFSAAEEIKQSTEDYYEKNYEKKHSAEVVEKSPDHPVFPYDAPPMPMEPWLPPTPTPDPWQPGSDDDYFSVTGSKEQDHRPDVNYKPYQSEPAYMGGSAEGFDRRGSAESHERRDSRETVAKPKIPKSVPKKFAHTKDKHGLFNRKKGKQKQAPKRRLRKIHR